MKYYYLRSGDFRAEELDKSAYKQLGYPTEEIAREQLDKAGNLFGSMEEARKASDQLRKLLIRLQKGPQECSQLYRMHSDSSQQFSSLSDYRRYLREKILHSGEPLSPSGQSVSYHKDGNSQGNGIEITLIVHLYS